MENKQPVAIEDESTRDNDPGEQGGRKWSAFLERGLLSGFRRKKTGREEILARFEKWLDQTLEKEEPLEGIDESLMAEFRDQEPSRDAPQAGEGGDLYGTWSAITALTQEVKLQGRAFKQLSETLTPFSQLNDSLKEVASVHRDTVTEWRRVAEQYAGALQGHQKAWKQEAETHARQEMIQVFLDIREGLLIGLRSVEESQATLTEPVRPGWFKRTFSKQDTESHPVQSIVESLKKGYRMGLDRIEEALKRLGVSEIPCQGLPFDPLTMTAVDLEEAGDQADGTVLEVYRTGYLMDGQVLRTAQVKVARHLEKT